MHLPSMVRLAWGYCALGLSLWCASVGAAQGAEATYEERVQPLLKKYCYDCHGGGEKEGNLTLDTFADNAKLHQDRALWWKVLKNLRAGVMPPADQPRPSSEELATITQWIQQEVFQTDPKNPDPGRLVVRRLNRSEYDNTIDDLMGVRFDATILFPPDDSGYGFDNVGDALSFSPLLMEKYLRAAQTIVEQTVPTETWIIPRQEFGGRDFRGERENINGGRLWGKGNATVRREVEITEPGIYDMQLVVKLHGSFDFDPARYTVAFSIDGQEQFNNEYGWDEAKPVRFVFRPEWTAGKHELVFTLTPVPMAATEPLVGVDRGGTDVTFEISSVRIEGPQGTKRREHPRNYSQFFPREEPPTSAEERREYAREILTKFATRAFRSPVDDATVNRLADLAESHYQKPGETFEKGIAHALIAVLASPRFLFRLEALGTAQQEVRFAEVNEIALASRLSYFLWSTMPDEELFRLAEAGELRKQLPQQIKRMLRHEKGNEFVRNFVGQWLRTRDVTQVSIDPIVVLGHQKEYERLREEFRELRRKPLSAKLTPEDDAVRKRFGEFRGIYDRFNDDMKRSMRRETEMFVEYIVEEDRSLLDLLDSDYTFVNEKLASLYDIPNVRGGEMRRVKLPEGSPRGGVLTQASMLLVTSNPTRTSPVKRGLFVLDNILGMPAPPAPAGVPDLEESAKRFAGREPSQRELLAAHRESPLCSSCHARMDPLGFALENFNALGMWRDKEHDQAIDASGVLITGETFQDIRDLKKILRERHATEFYRCVTEKMLTYALGRGLEDTDEHTIDLIVQRLEQNNGKFSALLEGVIASAPFQKYRLPESTTTAVTPSTDSTTEGASP